MNRPITLQPATCLGYLPVIKLTDPFHNLLTPPKRIYFPRGYRGCSLVHFPLYAPWTSYFNDIFYLSLAGYIGHRESALSTLFLCRAPKSRAVFPLLPLSNLVIIRSFIFSSHPQISRRYAAHKSPQKLAARLNRRIMIISICRNNFFTDRKLIIGIDCATYPHLHHKKSRDRSDPIHTV